MSTVAGCPPVIELRQVSKRYAQSVIALDDVSWTVSEPQLIAIIGANGSGKSSLLKLLAAKIQPDAGCAQVLQCDVSDSQSHRLKSRISYLSQQIALDPELTAQELLDYFAVLYAVCGSRRQRVLAQLVRQFDLTPLLSRKAATFSGGEKQRLHLALGLMHDPELLLLDEPASALDPAATALLWQVLSDDRQQGRTVLMVSHDLERVQAHCDRVVVLDKGRLLADGSPQALVAEHAAWRLQMQLDRVNASATGLMASLQRVSGADAVQQHDTEVRLQFSSLESSALHMKLQPILDWLDQHQITVIAHRWQEPSLAEVYFQLTGNRLQARTGRRGSHKRQQGGRRR